MDYTSATTHEGGMRCCTEYRVPAHAHCCTDVGAELGGKGEQPSPGDMLAAAVASCMLSMVAYTGTKKGFDTRGICIRAACGEGARGVGSLHFRISVPSRTTPLERRLIESAVANCPVGNSLHPDIPKEIIWEWAE